MRSWVQHNILKFIGNESHENIPEALHTVLGCIYNLYLLLISSDYCVTIKNEFSATFASLVIEVAECSVLSRIIG
jgi:hypothetical protein